MTTISSKNLARAIYLASENKNATEQATVAKNVISFLIKRRLFAKAQEIISFLNQIIDDKEGRIKAKVFSARKLHDEENNKIKEFLTKRYSAKEVIIEEKINRELINGFRIEVKDEVIDLTTKNTLKELQIHLIENI